ncbi:MAG TPA: prephenate dehydratase [Intrasporangiaceae bacterium]|nr:prephenate dehydratase [Intrasporangiaceae bacterium]
MSGGESTTDPQTYGYLGPAGTFTQMALHRWGVPDGAAERAFGSVDAALAALREGQIVAAMVPIENSVEGGVSATLDALAHGDPLVVIGEVLVPITFVLAARPGTDMAQVRRIGTHPHAWAQVRNYVAEHLPDAVYVPALSTAAAAASLATDPDAPFDASVSAPVAATSNGLTILAEDIGDMKHAVTRFVLVARPGDLPERTGADKTTVVLFQHHDRPGALLELLEQFSVRGINLTRLESRPTGESMGSYCFSVDFEGHVLDERVGEALVGLKRVCLGVRFLGSYPRADEIETRVAPDISDAAFHEARSWLADIRNHID